MGIGVGGRIKIEVMIRVRIRIRIGIGIGVGGREMKKGRIVAEGEVALGGVDADVADCVGAGEDVEGLGGEGCGADVGDGEGVIGGEEWEGKGGVRGGIVVGGGVVGVDDDDGACVCKSVIATS